MISRTLYNTIVESLKNFPIVGLIGSRQVGKTTLAKQIQRDSPGHTVYIDLELPSDLNKLQSPELYLNQFTNVLVIIDEIQRMPALFPLLRALIDQKRTNGRFFILGSASPELIKQSSESLAGRIIYHELKPFCIEEIGYDHSFIQNLWLKGGYPESFLADNDKISFQWREAFIRTYLERDIPQLGIKIPSLALRRFWMMLAHAHGQLWNASQIANSLDTSAPTVRHYLDILEETFIVRQLQPYYGNIKKRLIKSPKIYIRDTGLLHALLKNQTLDALHGHPSLGNSWEGFVIEQITALGPDTDAYFYRTSAGAEIDLLLFTKNNEPIAIEIKYSASPKPSKGFYSALNDLYCKKRYVIYPGQESYPITPTIEILSIHHLFRLFHN